jgi:ferredoxin
VCEFCTQHGEGKKWYELMELYSPEWLERDGRKEYIAGFIARFEEHTAAGLARLDALRARTPRLYRLVRPVVERRQKARHWGQVVPLEDAERILDLQTSIVRLPCVCRSVTTGREVRHCFGLGALPGIAETYPDKSAGLEVLTKEEAKAAIRACEDQGMVHSIWTFKTPFIGGLCNCDQDCLAYRAQVQYDLLKVMFRAEYVAEVDPRKCDGCRECLSYCHFGALGFSASLGKSSIEQGACYGCGVCRVACAQGAISLRPRAELAGLPW